MLAGVAGRVDDTTGWRRPGCSTPESMADTWNFLQHKDLEDSRFCCYGYGDGGGGATIEMLEVARRMADLEGCPRTSQVTLTEFMRGIERDMPRLPVLSLIHI